MDTKKNSPKAEFEQSLGVSGGTRQVAARPINRDWLRSCESPSKSPISPPYTEDPFVPYNCVCAGVYDFAAPAELFPSRNRKVASKVKYRRFDSAADAIRYAIEELPEPLLLGACIEINERRLGHQEIRALYTSDAYPLKKSKAA